MFSGSSDCHCWPSAMGDRPSTGVDGPPAPGNHLRKRWAIRAPPWPRTLRQLEGLPGNREHCAGHHTKTGWVALGRQLSGTDEVEQLIIAEGEWRDEHAQPHLTALLHDHAEKDWPRILERAAQGDFCTSGITQTHLLEDLLNPNTPPAVRELLAKTLQIRVEQDEVEDALKVFASSRSKRALHRLLAD